MKMFQFALCVMTVVQVMTFSISDISLYQYQCKNVEIEKNEKYVSINLTCESSRNNKKISFISHFEIGDKTNNEDGLMNNILSYYRTNKMKKQPEDICVECLVENLFEINEYNITSNNRNYVLIKKRNSTMTIEDYDDLVDFVKEYKKEGIKEKKSFIYFSSQEGYLKVLSKMIFICVFMILYGH